MENDPQRGGNCCLAGERMQPLQGAARLRVEHDGKGLAGEIGLNLQGRSADPKRAAAATFGRRLIEARGKVTDADSDAVRAAGFGEAEVVEVVALPAQVLMTKFMNSVADTEIDVPIAGAAA